MKRRAIDDASETAVASAFEAAHERLEAALRSFLDGPVAASPGRLLGDVSRQIRMEEELLFERFEDGTGLRVQGPTVLLRREHEEIIRRLESLATTAETSVNSDTRTSIRALLALLQDHRRREAVALFPICDRLLEGNERRRVLQQLGAIEPESTPFGADSTKPGRKLAGAKRGKQK